MNTKATYSNPLDPVQDCDCCGHGKDICQQEAPGNGMECTREKGHDGEHAACGDMRCQHPIVVWHTGDRAAITVGGLTKLTRDELRAAFEDTGA